MGHSHDEERRSITVPGATLSVKTRTDTAFFKKGEIKYPHGMKHSAGNLKEWKCGNEVAELKTDQASSTIVESNPASIVSDITGPQFKATWMSAVPANVVAGKEHAFRRTNPSSLT